MTVIYYNHHPSSPRRSPISALPVELLSEIFTLCALCSGDDLDLRVNSEDAAQAEAEADAAPLVHTGNLATTLLLSGVCRRWRRVVRGQANLWANVCVSAQMLRNVDAEGEERGMRRLTLTLDTAPIAACLARSRQHPLNIMIDARDENWNFVEPDVSSSSSSSSSSGILFTPAHMHTALALLLPHLARWKSLTILTDTWAPMHAALRALNPALTSSGGAPQLRWLSLMRCNEFASFAPKFQPQNLKEPAFLASSETHHDTPARPLLPSLQHLSLRGVHPDWAALSRALTPALTSLDLQSHAPDVRPSLAQFAAILRAAPALRALTVSGSGPELDGGLPSDDDQEEEEDVPRGYDYDYDCDMADLAPAPLHALESLTLGYRTAPSARLLLASLDAPNTRTLALEDATYPGDPEEVDAGGVLAYLGAQVRADDTPGRSNGCSTQSPPFPLLARVALRQVKCSVSSLRAFLSALPGLRHLELAAMPVDAVRALLPPSVPSSPCSSTPCSPRGSPSASPSASTSPRASPSPSPRLPPSNEASPTPSPCPHLRTLLLKHPLPAFSSSLPDLFDLSALPNVQVSLVCESDYEDDSDADGEYDENENEEDNECGNWDHAAHTREAEEAEAFKPGGAFNDPDFDAYYALRLASLSSVSSVSVR